MAVWEFNRADPSDVKMDPNQGDQFNNDDVGLAEALVREVIQNSSDASDQTGPVKVRFRIRELTGSSESALKTMLSPLGSHLEACKFKNAINMADGTIRTLTVEDFNTKGLTGSFDTRDDDNFTNFWRNLARSAKSGKDGGRWGLGKLVFSSASGAKAFFGLTRRNGDHSNSVMGQAVLRHHVINGKSYVPHGFWFSHRSDNEQNLQLPVSDPEKVSDFSALAGFTRTDQAGLSILIPFLAEGIDDQTILSGVVRNYYFPILSGKLEVEVGDKVVNSETFLSIAQSLPDTGVPFEFVKEISDRINGEPDFLAGKNIGKVELDDGFFQEEVLEEMKAAYAAGKMIKIRVPIVLRPKMVADKGSHLDLYLKTLPENEQPFSLHSRGPIILSAERRYFSGAAAWGALVADDPLVAAFLGDAENPAHTRWNPHAEKVKNNWRMPIETLVTIRRSLKNLYNLVAELEELEDTEALIDFFSIAEPEKTTTGKKKETPKPEPDPQPQETAIRVLEKKGGFSVVSGPGTKKWSLPRVIRIRVAYDMIGANPFKRHSPHDFNFQKGKDISVQSIGAEITLLKSNILLAKIVEPDFRIDLEGFDLNRDIVAEARLVEQKS